MGASMLFSVTEFAISVPIMWLVYEGPQNFSTYMTHNISHYFLASFRVGILIYWVILAFGHALDYYYEFQGERARAGQLAAQLAQAELHALKMQLHPHFLFNTLHSISALLHEDIDAADQMIECLGNFLRLTLSNAGLQEVPLRQEMEFIRCYLEIEQIRFQDRLTVRMDIDPQTLDAQVPNLLWQPLVENAIKHGIEPQAAPGGCIEIGVHRDKDLLRLYVQDNGPGLPGGSSGECSFREGVGLSNTRARLQQLYGTSYRFELTNAAQGGVLVLLEIPFKTVSPDKIERIELRS
jgi:LytS/YehU family sensor histidine kinase